MSIRRRRHEHVGEIATCERDLLHMITLKSHKGAPSPAQGIAGRIDPAEFSAQKMPEFASFPGP
jgi:hypothetical protein